MTSTHDNLLNFSDGSNFTWRRWAFKRDGMKPYHQHMKYSSFPTPKSQTNNDKKNSSKGHPGEAVHPGRGSRSRARITLKELAQIHRVIHGILPYAKIYKSQTGCKFGEKCSFLHRKTDRQPKRTRKGGGKGSVAFIKNVKQFGLCSSGC